MAIIGTIRNKGMSVLVALLAISLLAFVASDWINSSGGGNQKQVVGSIAGVEIPNEDFQIKLKSREDGFRTSRGTSPNENERAQIQQEVWNTYIYDIAFGNEVEELGVSVTEEELVDLVQGDYVHPQLQQQFRGQDGQFSKQQLIQYLKFIGQEWNQNLPVSQADFLKMKYNFIKFEEELPLTRQIEKYNALLGKSTYVTSLEAKNKHIADNESVDAKVLYVPYMSILDSSIEVSDAELKTYISENSSKYKTDDASRSLEYVVFPIKASSEDSAVVKDELMEMKDAFTKAENDSVFVRAKADNPTMPVYQSLGTLPKFIQEQYPNLDTGMVFGPMLEGASYKMYKVSGIKNDTVYSARASHILFKAASDSDEDLAIALADAKKVLNEIRNGADFAEMASIHGTDGTKNTGGDLGWFTEGRMVTEFNDAVMDANREGLLPTPVKTNFGYHIIKVTGVKTSVNYQIASIDREITAGEETREIAYQKAASFASENADIDAFETAVEADAALMMQTSESIKSSDRFLRGAGNARSAVQWAFNENTTVGEVSDVLDLEDGYLVVALKGANEAGLADLESVRREVTTKVINKKKAEQIIAKLNGTSGSLEEKLNAYGTDANIVTATSVTLNSSSIPGVGYDPALSGTFLGLNAGETSEPIAGETGVVIVEATNKTPAADKPDYTAEKSQLLNNTKGRAAGYSFEAIKKAADIEDKRVNFM